MIMIEKIKGNPVDVRRRRRDIREIGGKKRRQREPLLPKSEAGKEKKTTTLRP
jgi:hypothetical protein